MLKLGTVRAVDQFRNVVLAKDGEKISWTDHVRNEEVSHWVRGGEEYRTDSKMKRKANWIGHILRWNCLLKRVIKRKVEGTMCREDAEEDVSSYSTP